MAKPHDNAYKFLFQNKRIFLQLLHSFVKEDFVKNVKEDDLSLADKTFVSEDMLDRESDLLYKVNINGRETYIYILIEFQSTPDKAIPVRMFQYILLLYDQLLKNSKRGLLPNVFPLLLYNGSKNWDVPRNIRDIIDTNIPEKFIPSFEYFALILNKVPDTYLDNLSNLIAAVIRMENAGNEKKLRIAIDRIVMYIRYEDPSDIRDYFIWLKHMFQNDLKEIRVDTIHDIMEVKPMLAELVEKIEKKNLKEGERRGEIRGEKRGEKRGEIRGEKKAKLETAQAMLKEGIPIAMVSKCTGLTAEEITSTE